MKIIREHSESVGDFIIDLGFVLDDAQAGMIHAVVGQSSDGMWENSNSKRNKSFWILFKSATAGDDYITFDIRGTWGRDTYYIEDVGEDALAIKKYISYKLVKIVKEFILDNGEAYTLEKGIVYLDYSVDGGYVSPSAAKAYELAKLLRRG